MMINKLRTDLTDQELYNLSLEKLNLTYPGITSKDVEDNLFLDWLEDNSLDILEELYNKYKSEL